MKTKKARFAVVRPIPLQQSTDAALLYCDEAQLNGSRLVPVGWSAWEALCSILGGTTNESFLYHHWNNNIQNWLIVCILNFPI